MVFTRWKVVLLCSPTRLLRSARLMPSGEPATASRMANARSNDWMPPRSFGASSIKSGSSSSFTLVFFICNLRILDRCGHDYESEITQAVIGDGVDDPWGNENNVVLADNPPLAVDLHRALSFEHMVDLLLHLVGMGCHIGHRLVGRDAIVDQAGARCLRPDQRLG